MTEKTLVPININPLYEDKFKFILEDAKHVEFFCSSVNIPGVSASYIQQATPTGQFFVGGKKLHYEDLILTFRVSEDLENYKEIFNWLHGIHAPQDTDQFKEFNDKKLSVARKYNIASDATLFSLTNASNGNIEFSFKNLFPFSLTGIQMNIEGKQTITATVGFRYDYYTIN